MTNEYIVDNGGYAFVVPKNHNFKFELLEGQQILDVAIWSKDNPKKEFLSMHQTLFATGRFIHQGSALWSDYKRRRVIAECVEKTEYESSNDGWHHHLVQGYCDDDETGGTISCKTNFLNSIKKFGLGAKHLNDNTINLFEKSISLTEKNTLKGGKSESKKGDYITFKSYIDLIVSVSLCPQVDFLDGYHYNPQDVKPIKVSIYE